MATWIFQGNPDRFNIEGYLAQSSGLILWRAAQHASEMKAGDTVYLWRSQGSDTGAQSGVIAEGTIVETPRARPDDPSARPFWLNASDALTEHVRVAIRINRIAAKKEVLKREWLKEDSVLSSLPILRQPVGTNFSVTAEQSRRLGELWRKTGTDWQRDEVVAALFLYEELRETPISKVPGSPVETVAQKLGRAPTGVDNKLMNLRALDPRAPQKGLDGGSLMDRKVWAEYFDSTSNVMRDALTAEYLRLWGDTPSSDIPADAALEEEQRRLTTRSLADLMASYATRPRNERPQRRAQSSSVYDRDPMVVAITKKAANSQCEVDDCTSPPFNTNSGELYVEVHHLRPLAEGGKDVLENAVAVCPTHHRHLHFGQGRDLLRESLLTKVLNRISDAAM